MKNCGQIDDQRQIISFSFALFNHGQRHLGAEPGRLLIGGDSDLSGERLCRAAHWAAACFVSGLSGRRFYQFFLTTRQAGCALQQVAGRRPRGRAVSEGENELVVLSFISHRHLSHLFGIIAVSPVFFYY